MFTKGIHLSEFALPNFVKFAYIRPLKTVENIYI